MVDDGDGTPEIASDAGSPIGELLSGLSLAELYEVIGAQIDALEQIDPWTLSAPEARELF